MKCTKCKGDGRELAGGRWGKCSKCEGTGTEPEPVPVPVPTLQSIMASGFDEAGATAILLWEELKASNDGKPPAAIPVKVTEPTSNILNITAVTRVGKIAKLKSGGPDMLITADLGGDELACEWEVMNGDVKGKESRTFQAASLVIGE